MALMDQRQLRMKATCAGRAACILMALSVSARGNNDCGYVDSVVVTDVRYTPDPPALPTGIMFTLNVTHHRQCGGNCPITVQVRIVLLDCDGLQIGNAVAQTFTPVCPSQQQTTTWQPDPIPLCQPLPKYYRIDEFEGCNSESGCINAMVWVTGQPVAAPVPEFHCPATVEQLVCYTCDPPIGTISDVDLRVYKSRRDQSQPSYSIYTLRQDDSTGATWGEVINGEFKAPNAGLLLVKADGGGGAVDLWASPSASARGWLVVGDCLDAPPTGWCRFGDAVVTERCVTLNTDQVFQFNVLASKSDHTFESDFNATFNWYWWNSLACCLQHDQKVLHFQVRPLPCLKDAIDPVMPQRGNCLKSDNTVDVEIKRPCCPTRADEPGNLSDWFVVWPTAENAVIPEGHAKGWQITPNMLISPAPGKQKYIFAY